MKRFAVLFTIALLALGTISVLALGDGPGQVLNTKHNLSLQSGETTHATTAGAIEVCVFCHTPHNAAAAPVYTGAQIIPLWNHTTTAAAFTVYSSATMEAAVNPPSAASQACLSCHDGTVGVGQLLNVYLTTTGVATTLAMTGNVGAAPYRITGTALFGTDLSNDHPISFNYATHQATDNGLRLTTAALPANQPVTGTVASLLINNNVECGSCHAVHGLNPSFAPTAPDTLASFDPLMRISRYDSKLCTACHIK